MTRRFLFPGLLVATAFAHMHTAAAQTFPLLGAYLIGGDTTGLTPAHVAPLGVLALGAYVGWKNTQGLDANEFAAEAKDLNPNLKIFVYNHIEAETNPPSTMGESNSDIASVPWWALTAWPGGSRVADGGSGHYAVNITTNTRLLNGQNYPEWRAEKDHTSFLEPNPAVNGLYIDNFNYEPPVTADYAQSGSSQSPSTAGPMWRAGYVTYVKALRASSPASQQLVLGNLATWLPPSVSKGRTITEFVSPTPVLNGGEMEHIIGQSYSVETFSGWKGMMAYYSYIMASVAAPKLVIFSQDASSKTDYQGFRYGFASCLLGNAYYYSDDAQNYNDFLTYDEYSFKLGTATTAALVFPGATAYQHGVYRRDFANGIVLVNPKGNGVQTVTLETSYKHLSGTQDRTVNNGETVTSVTLKDRDGVILERTTQ
jgi:Hypothetical glycosyl hydrolase family 15